MWGRTVFLAFIGIILGCTTVMADATAKEKAALASAEKWLRLVDEGKYAESWLQASDYFRQAVKQDQWVQMVRGVREPLGRTVSRKMRSAVFMTSLPGAPDGQYVVITFDASFAHKKAGVETVTPKLDGDGTWRVSGYFIR